MSTNNETHEVNASTHVLNFQKQEFKALVIKLQAVFPDRKYDTQKFSTRKLNSFRKTAEELETRNVNKIKAKNFRNSKIEEYTKRSMEQSKGTRSIETTD